MTGKERGEKKAENSGKKERKDKETKRVKRKGTYSKDLL